MFLVGVFFLWAVVIYQPSKLAKIEKKEVFGFAPYWTISKLDNVDWKTLTTFAYFSVPVLADGTFDRSSYEWTVLESKRMDKYFELARENDVKRVVTLTQMEAPTIEAFLNDRNAWGNVARESITLLREKDLDGINVDFEYIPSDNHLKSQFTDFMVYYTKELKGKLDDPYITVSVLASSVRFNRIYDVGLLSQTTDGVMMMAYDFYTAGSDTAGPSAPLTGYDNGTGPFWYDVTTAVDDFVAVADPDKIIMGVPYYGWNYNTYDPSPNTQKAYGDVGATTQEKLLTENLLQTTPFGGWDDKAKVSWRGYWDSDGWHVVYMEDTKSLGLKYDLINKKGLGGVGIWALGYDAGDDSLWALLKEKFARFNLLAETQIETTAN